MKQCERDNSSGGGVRAGSAAAILASACERVLGRGLGRDGFEPGGSALEQPGCADTHPVTSMDVDEEVRS